MQRDPTVDALPVSSFYHVVLALLELLSLEPKLSFTFGLMGAVASPVGLAWPGRARISWNLSPALVAANRIVTRDLSLLHSPEDLALLSVVAATASTASHESRVSSIVRTNRSGVPRRDLRFREHRHSRGGGATQTLSSSAPRRRPLTPWLLRTPRPRGRVARPFKSPSGLDTRSPDA